MNAPLRDPDAWRPTPAQRSALACGAYELLYGGAAGGGKSDYLLTAPLRWAHLPTFRALLLRRSFPELERTLIARSRDLYPRLGGTYHESRHDWTFASGARIAFGYLERPADALRYQGAEFQFCVALGTPVLMADGSWRTIEAVRVGDLVATLIGPRPVTATHRPGRKPVVRVEGPAGGATVSASHRLLTSHGWASPAELMTTGCRESDSTPEASPPQRRECGSQAECPPSGLRQEPALSQRTLPGTPLPGHAASAEDPQSGSAASGDGRREPLQPLSWSGLVALYGPAPASAEPVEEPAIPLRVPARASERQAPAGCSLDCPRGRRSGGGRLHVDQAVAQARTPSPAGAAASSARSGADGQGSTPVHSPVGLAPPRHPYTTEALPVSEAYHLAPARMAPAGEAEVADLTVAEASHYVTSGGFVAQNCGFDELTHFDEASYRYLSSRLRSSDGLPVRIRATTNPGGPGHDWVRARWSPWIGSQRAALPGERRWYAPDGSECAALDEHALERTFFPARLDDNPYLGAEYRAQLLALDPVTRAQLLDGDWDAAAGEGKLFHRDWWTYLDAAPSCTRKVRAWDLGAGGDPTEGVLLGDRGANVVPRYVVLDVVTHVGPPHEVHALIARTAEADGRSVTVRLPQDPGQAGKDQALTYARELTGYTVRTKPVTGDKVTRAGGFSSQVGARNAAVLRAPWTPGFVGQLHAFPDSSRDDKVDAAADAFAELTGSSGPARAFNVPGL